MHSCRSAGFGPGPIPYTAVVTWGREHYVSDADELDDLVYLVFELDAAWLEYEANAAENGGKGGK